MEPALHNCIRPTLVEVLPRSRARAALAFATSASVGAIASVVDWLVLVGAVALGCDQRYAVLPAILAGMAIQFVGNRRFTFGAHRELTPAIVAQQLRRFAVAEVLTLALNAGLYNVLREALHVDFRIARVIAAFAVYTAFSYPMWRWAFARTR